MYKDKYDTYNTKAHQLLVYNLISRIIYGNKCFNISLQTIKMLSFFQGSFANFWYRFRNQDVLTITTNTVTQKINEYKKIRFRVPFLIKVIPVLSKIMVPNKGTSTDTGTLLFLYIIRYILYIRYKINNVKFYSVCNIQITYLAAY